MKLSARKASDSEVQAPYWEVYGNPSVEKGFFVWGTNEIPRGYFVKRVRLHNLTDNQAERIQNGDPSVYKEIAEGPDRSGLIRLALGYHATEFDPENPNRIGVAQVYAFHELAPYIAEAHQAEPSPNLRIAKLIPETMYSINLL
jgi:hypothetical protein